MKFVELTPAEFKKFEQKQETGNFFQTAERLRLREKMGWRIVLLGVCDDGKIVAASFLMERTGNALVQLGPIMNYEDIAVLKTWIRGVKKYCSDNGYISLEVFPPMLIAKRSGKGEILNKYDDAKVIALFEKENFSYYGKTEILENKANRWMAVKDLSDFGDMAAIRASYKKNVRNKLRKISAELEVSEVFDEKGLVEFAQVVDESNRKNSVVSRNFEYYKWMREAWGDQLRVVLARRKSDGKAVAGRMLIYHPNEVVSFISGTAQNFKRYNGMTYLQDWLLEDCLAKGISRVNFYGVDGIFTPENKLLEFKNGFGVIVEEYVGGFLYILNKEAYAKQQRKVKISTALRAAKQTVVSLVLKIKKNRTKVVRKVKSK